MNMKKTIRTIVMIWVLVLMPLGAGADTVGFHLPETPNLQIVRYRPLFTLPITPYQDVDLYVWSPVALYENRLISILFQIDPRKAFESEESLRPFYAFAEEVVTPEYDVDMIVTIMTDQELGRPDWRKNVFVYYFSQYIPQYSRFYAKQDNINLRKKPYDPTDFSLISGIRTKMTVPEVKPYSLEMSGLRYQEKKPPKIESKQGYLIFLGVVALFFLRKFRKIFMVATAGMAIWVIFYIFSNI